ncbi:hypothetical protein 000TH008_235 [Bacillus phage 000TH008]|nr:hypothetical protein 000TH008_235 [Bacillus phage 000TH008]
MKMLKLSELPDYVELSIIDSSLVYTVEELKKEIAEYGEPHHLAGDWYVIQRKKWVPNAVDMVDCYLESKADDMYDDWYERAFECFSQRQFSKIQSVLEEAFDTDYATAYWDYCDSVAIDIIPHHKDKCGVIIRDLDKLNTLIDKGVQCFKEEEAL